MNYRLPLAICTIAALAACDQPQRQAEAAKSVAPSAISVPNKGGLIPGTPTGDLGDWVKDIREGIAKLPALARTNVAAAQSRALELYVTRQEYNEMYYGVNGRTKVSEELAKEIATAEERFHELLQLLGTKNPSNEAVKASVATLDKQQGLVVSLWTKTGAHLERPI